MAINYNDKDVMDFLNGIMSGQHNQDTQKSNNLKDDEYELDFLFEEYTRYIDDLKADGYKVLRNSVGKHKIVKGNY